MRRVSILLNVLLAVVVTLGTSTMAEAGCRRGNCAPAVHLVPVQTVRVMPVVPVVPVTHVAYSPCGPHGCGRQVGSRHGSCRGRGCPQPTIVGYRFVPTSPCYSGICF